MLRIRQRTRCGPWGRPSASPANNLPARLGGGKAIPMSSPGMSLRPVACASTGFWALSMYYGASLLGGSPMTSAVPLDALSSKKPLSRRYSVQIEGDFVVFLIGMRVNAWWKIHKWLPVLKAMRPMLEELVADPESGLLCFHRVGKLTFVQYWRSFEQLEAYARAPNKKHWPAWLEFNKRMKARWAIRGHLLRRSASGPGRCWPAQRRSRRARDSAAQIAAVKKRASKRR